jgi:hypothetical protein
METTSGPSLPTLVSEFHTRLRRSLFRSLGAPILDLAEHYGQAYLQDFERHLGLLRSAFPVKIWPDWAVQGFINLNKAILKEELSFRQTGQYTSKPEDLQRVT